MKRRKIRNNWKQNFILWEQKVAFLNLETFLYKLSQSDLNKIGLQVIAQYQNNVIF